MALATGSSLGSHTTSLTLGSRRQRFPFEGSLGPPELAGRLNIEDELLRFETVMVL
jgi:hypothetical protein